VTTFTNPITTNRTGVTDANLKTWTFTYDAKNRQGTVTEPTLPASRTTRWQYDVADQLLKVVTPSGRAMRYDYDTRGQQQTITDGLGNNVTFGYDNRGNLTTLKDQRNNTTAFSYDELFRLTGRRDPLGRQVTVEYDPVGNVTAQTDRMGRRTTIVYDNINRPTTVSYVDATVTYQYDAAGRGISISDASGTITWQYDNANRVTAEITNLGTVTYAYNNANQRSSMTAADRPPVTYGYDTAGRLQTISQTMNGVTELFTYGYDTLSRRTQLQRQANGAGIVTTDYEYDEISRLKRLKHTRVSTGTLHEDFQYEYNLDDEITKITSLASAPLTPQSKTATTADAANRVPQFGTASYSFNQEGQTTAKTDVSGTTGYQWDARGRLTQASLPSGQAVNYGYDALGRRINRVANGLTTTFQYDAADVVVDRVSDGSAYDYINGLDIDDKLRQSGGSWGTMNFLQDHLGNTVGLVGISGGLVESNQQYDVFGSSAGSARARYGYTGRERDELSGLMHYRARWYDSQQGRFISEDPIGFAGGTNLFVYVANNPVSYVDPSGYILLNLATGFIGGVIGAGASVISQGINNRRCGRSFFYNINGKSVLVAGGVGFVSGALAPFVAGSYLGATLLGAGSNVAQYLGTQAVNSQSITGDGIFLNAATGALGGAIGGPVSRATGLRFNEASPHLNREIGRTLNESFDIAANVTKGALARSTVGGLASSTIGPKDCGCQ
jgi:RHS repeat-associated protein